MADGTITRKDIITDEALNWMPEYKSGLTEITTKQKEFVGVILSMNEANTKLRISQDQSEYKAALNEVNLESKKAILTLKERLIAETNLEKIKQEAIKTSKSGLDLDVKKAKANSEITKLLAEEEKLSQEKLKTEKESLIVEKQLIEIETKKQQLKNAGISVSKSELDLLQKEETIKRNKLKQLQDEENKLKQLQEVSKQSIVVWKEQNQAELALISTKRKNELATEGTNRSLVKERVLLAETNKEIKLQAREQLGMVTAYEKLNRARSEAQKRLADLLSAEKKSTVEVVRATLEFDKLDARVKAVDASIRNYSKNIGNYGSAFEGLNGTLQDLMSTFGLVTGLALFGVIVKDIFTVVKDFDRQLIAVGKTTNITGDNLKQFGREVVDLGDKLDGITVDGLIQSAEVAGQLGVNGTANILKFSEAIEKLKLTSNIISDEQVGQFAKFIEVSSDSFENADKLASVITQLGNSFATTEAEVLANATEIQKGIAVYKTSAQGVLALGSATSTLGSEAESSRSAIQSTFAVINNAIATGANLEKVLKLTGLTQKELSKQFNQDATGVFVKFVKGLSDAKKGGENLALVLNDVEITEKRAFTVIGSLAANYGILEQSMAQANKEYVDNAALNKEVAAASESIDSIIGDSVDRWQAYVLQTNDANNGTEALTKTLKFLRDNFKEIINFVLKAGAVLFTYLGVVKAVNFVMAASAALQVAWTAGQIRFALATGIGTQSILAQAAAARTAMIAQEGLNVAVKATPWGLIIGLLLATTTAYAAFNDEMSESEKNIQKIIDANKKLQDSEKSYAEERDSSRNEDFKGIEDDIRLRKAKGENSDKLDKEEIARKKEILQAQISVYSDLKSIELERTKTDISNSRQRIAQMETEQNILEKSGFRVSKQGRTSEDLSNLIATEKEKLNTKKASFSENSKLAVDEQARLSKLMQDLDKDAAVKDAEFKSEENKKAKALKEKEAKDALDRDKRLWDSLYELKKQQLERAIKINEDVAKDNEQTDEVRIAALEVSQKKQIALTELTKKHSLDADKFVLAKDKLNANQKTFIANEAANKIVDINKKTSDEIEKIRLFDEKAFTDDLLKKITEVEIASDKEITNENEEYKKILENKLLSDKEIQDAARKHEENLFNIKLKASKELAKILIANTELELEAYKLQSDGSEKSNAFILALEKKLFEAKAKLSGLGLEKFNSDEDAKIMTAKEKAVLTLEIAMDVTNELGNLSNAFSEAKIQKVDEEIDKNNEYYDKQIELAGNDERQKDLLQKERDKKNEALEKKKRAAQHKQAVFDKALNVSMIAMATALAVIKAWTEGDPYTKVARSIAAGVVGAIQLAAALATPIPKYKMGRVGGPAETAWVGDGGVPEVVTGPDGSNPRLTPNTPTLTNLGQGDIVHKSVKDYNRYIRASILSGFNQDQRKMSEFQNNQYSDVYGKESLQVMKQTLDVLKKQKNGTVVNMPKLDINHHLWKMGNTNWKP